jgi:wyosine [tRNA(Phe)-imidazoG37] synthetase (radical SAM superfamily)
MEKTSAAPEAQGLVEAPLHRLALAPPRKPTAETAFGRPRYFFNNRFVYAVISQRARGLSIGINMNPDKFCNFDCLYCEVNRDEQARDRQVNIKVMASELESLLALVHQGRLREFDWFRSTPEELLRLKEVALSGDGEPTLSPNFTEIVREVVHIRSVGCFPFFKIVLITNGTGLHLPEVRTGLQHLTSQDEIWAKLDAGTQEYMERVNRPDATLKRILSNIQLIGRERPIVIQSLFPQIDTEEPSVDEIDEYVARLKELKKAGAQISLVQVYSAHRPPHHPNCGHLPLKVLSKIAQRVREVTGLPAEVF